MKNEAKPAPSRKERKLQREVAQLQNGLAASQCEASANQDAAVSACKTAQYYEERANRFRAESASLQSANAHLEHTRRIAAEGLLLERDELMVRVRRIEFRVQGLGFNV